jgi:hypothetical protein
MRKTIVAAALALAAGSAMADLVFYAGAGDYVRLTGRPCDLEMTPDWQALNPHAAIANVNGKQFAACWVLVPRTGVVALRYEDNDFGSVLLSAFKPAIDG